MGLPVAGWTQQRFAIVHTSTPIDQQTATSPYQQWRAFFSELEQLGFAEGKNIVVERYYGEGRTDRYAELAKEVVRRNPDVIFTNTVRLMKDFKSATETIPVVGVASDPVAAGLASSLAKPGGNLTGVATDAGYEMMEKRFALLRELLPSVIRIAFLGPKAFWELHSHATFKNRLGARASSSSTGRSKARSTDRSTLACLQPYLRNAFRRWSLAAQGKTSPIDKRSSN
jgi:hypothetical protein